MKLNGESWGWESAIAEWAAYLAAGARRPATIAKRSYYLDRMGRDLGTGPWDVTSRQLVGWLAGHEWAPETRKSARAAVVGFYRWAVLMGYIGVSPAEVLPRVMAPRRAVSPVADEVIDTAIARASERDALMLLLGSRAGLRRAEIAGLAWGDVAEGTLTVRAGKGGRGRTLPISVPVRRALDLERQHRDRGELGSGWRYWVDPASPWVFPAQAGGHMSADTVGAIITRALGNAGTSHGLRRRFASAAYRGTRDIRSVQELLGHSSVTTTQLYVVIAADDLVSAVAAAA